MDVLINVKEILENVKAPEPTIIITRDFNFAFKEWKRGEYGLCEWEKKRQK